MKKKTKTSQEEKPFSYKQSIIISMVLVAAILISFLVFNLLQVQTVKFSLNAAIIDQLGMDFPNAEFRTNATSLLENAGFSVSYYPSVDVKVDFYKRLAEYNYGLIILRTHSAIREGESIVDFFTSEEFDYHKYPSDKINGFVTGGYYQWRPDKYYFAVSPKLIENLKGQFPKSIVIAMGCNSLNQTCKGMAEAFIKKGAKAYIGWTGLVDSSHTDNETLKLLKRLLTENETITTAVSAVSQDWHFYPPSSMAFHPQSVADLRISDLIEEAKTASTVQLLSDNVGLVFLLFCLQLMCCGYWLKKSWFFAESTTKRFIVFRNDCVKLTPQYIA